MSFSDGGPAFPVIGARTAPADYPGMTLRDYFAGQALKGVLAADANPKSDGAIPVDETAARFVAEHVWRYADAMLKTRRKEP